MKWILALFGALSTPSSAGAGPDTVPSDLNEFGLVCFCSSRVATPHMPISLDNNGRLLFALRSGSTREALRASGIAFNDSQVQMLKDWGLLTEEKGLLATAFPVLEPAAMAALHKRLEPIVAGLRPVLRPHARAIKNEMASRGQGDATYAVLFAYVLDGLVWKELESSGSLPQTQVTVERPFWSGTFWAVYPRQDQMPGTNSRSAGRGELRALWTPAVVQQINAFHSSREATNWLAAVDKGGALPALYPDSRLRTVLIREESMDKVFRHGSAIAKAVASKMLEADLSPELPQADASQRLLIGTHELVWLLLGALAADERISQPAVLSRGARSSSDLAPLVVGVLRPGSHQ